MAMERLRAGVSRARIVVVQFAEDAPDPRRNLEAMKRDVQEHRASDLVVFPELALCGHAVTEQPARLHRAHEAVHPEDIEAFDRFVAEQGARVIYGELFERDGRLYNAATYTDGKQRVSYLKTHVHWTEPFAPGAEFPVVDTPLGPTGMLICFDAAFPEVPRILALRGAKAVVNISAIPEHFPLAHVHKRVVACSVQNQTWTVFANRTGRGFLGGSMVVDPTGEVVALAKPGDRTLVADVDPGLVDAWRGDEPLFVHRRPNIYSEITRGST